MPYAIDDNLRGKATIKVLGLDRDKLNEARQKHYEFLKCLNEIARSNLPMNSYAKACLEKAVQESEPYAAMARAAIASQFSPEA